MPYTYEQADKLDKHEMVGSHQCVALVQLYAGAPVTSAWRQGDAVVGNIMLKKGTAIATFVRGRYQIHAHGNHAALFLRQGIGGDLCRGPVEVEERWQNHLPIYQIARS